MADKLKDKQGLTRPVIETGKIAGTFDAIIPFKPEQISDALKGLKNGDISKAMAYFHEMERRDADIRSDMAVRKNEIASRPIKALPPQGEKKSLQAEFLQEVFSERLTDLPRQLADAIPKGLALTEIYYEPDGRYTMPSATVAVEPWRLSMSDEPFAGGRLFDFPKLLTEDGFSTVEIKPAEKFLFHRHDSAYSASLDSGLMVTLALPFIVRNYALKDWATFLEQYGMPMIFGRYGQGATDAEKEALKQVVLDLASDRAAVVPEGMQIDIIERKGGEKTSYHAFLDSTKAFISKVCLGATLTTNEPEHATRSQAEVHARVREDLLRYDASEFERTLNRLARRLIDLNFGAGHDYPRVVIDLDTSATLETIRTVFDMGLPVSKSDLYERFSLREPESEEDALKKASPIPALPENNEIKTTAIHAFSKERKPITLDSLIEGGVASLGGVYETLLEEVISLVQESGYAEAARTIFARYPVILKAVGDALTGLTSASELMGLNAEPDSTDMAAFAAGEITADPLTPEKAVEEMRRRFPISNRKWKALSKKWKARSFSIAGVESMRALGKTRDLIVESLRDGLTFEAFRERAIEAFDSEGLTRLNPHHLKTVFETNLTTAYQAGRWRGMKEGATERPYWQFVTAGDNRVRPAHRALDGKVFRHDHPFWQSFFPPLGFGCRCTVVSISEEEMQEEGLTPETKTPGYAVDPESGAEVPIRTDEGFDHSPDDFHYSAAEFTDEMAPLLDDLSLDWEKLGRPDATKIDGTTSIPKLTKGMEDLQRENSGLSRAELTDLGVKAMAEQMKPFLTGWPEKFEAYIPTIYKENILFDRSSAEHVLDKFFNTANPQDRLRYLPHMMDTLRDPWEVWVTRSTGESRVWGLSYLKMYSEKSGNIFCRIDILPGGALKTTTFFATRRKGYLNRNRSGAMLLYSNDRLVSYGQKK